MKRFTVLISFSLLLGLLWYFGTIKGYLRAITPPPAMIKIMEKVGLTYNFNQMVQTAIPQTSPDEIKVKINLYRESRGLPALRSDSKVCELNLSSDNPQATQQVLSACPTCTHTAIISVTQFISPNELLTLLINQDSANNNLLDEKASVLCVKEKDNSLTLIFARLSPAGSVTPAVSNNFKKPELKSATQTPKNYSETELWQALVDYRHAHERSDLILDESICRYARKRVQDHLSLIEDKKPSEYPNPDKYPLDAHQGFSSDASTGSAFEITGKNHLAENLAYWPDAQYANQIIEWGWDTSTEGHRETQLSNDWTHGCIAGGNGFYVAIFGY